MQDFVQDIIGDSNRSAMCLKVALIFLSESVVQPVLR